MNFNGIRIRPSGIITWPGDGSKLLSSDGSQTIVGDGLTLSGGTLTADEQWPGTSSEMLAADGSSVTVGDGLNINAGTISSTNIKSTYTSSVDASYTQLVATNVGDVIHASDGIYICTSLSPLTWEKFNVASTITFTL
jgi:hypothetical protein